VLSENNISFHQVSTSEISVSLVVDTDKAKDVARLLSKEFEI
jgi:aspartate kinase